MNWCVVDIMPQWDYSSSRQYPQEIGATCLFLASKTEENGKRLEDIVTVMLAKVHGIAPAEVEGMYEAVSNAVNYICKFHQTVIRKPNHWSTSF